MTDAFLCCCSRGKYSGIFFGHPLVFTLYLPDKNALKLALHHSALVLPNFKADFKLHLHPTLCASLWGP